jgi:cation transport ATPase
MSFDDWLLALHLLAAFSFMGAIVFFWVLIVAGWKTERPSAAAALLRLNMVPNVMVGAGAVLALVFGVWLAISLDSYQPWDGWVIAALVLWGISVETGRRGGAAYERAGALTKELVAKGDDAPNSELGALLRDRNALTLNLVSSLAALLILVVMIWKPGA